MHCMVIQIVGEWAENVAGAMKLLHWLYTIPKVRLVRRMHQLSVRTAAASACKSATVRLTNNISGSQAGPAHVAHGAML